MVKALQCTFHFISFWTGNKKINVNRTYENYDILLKLFVRLLTLRKDNPPFALILNPLVNATTASVVAAYTSAVLSPGFDSQVERNVCMI